jgi:hypothetical protein
VEDCLVAIRDRAAAGEGQALVVPRDVAFAALLVRLVLHLHVALLLLCSCRHHGATVASFYF